MGKITEKNYKRFKAFYDEAVQDGKKSFIFEGDEILTSYAKYVVEYFILSVGYMCNACGHGPWKPRGNQPPKFCPACHSIKWNLPKKERGGNGK